MDVQGLLERFVQQGVTVVMKVDDERYAESGDYWTLILSGRALGEGGHIRTEESSLEDCLRRSLSELRSRDEQWSWVADHL